MARKRKQEAVGAEEVALRSSEHGAKPGAAPDERKVADMSVRELMDLVKIAAPRAAQATRHSIHAETRVVDLTVGDLLRLLTILYW